MIKVIVSGHGDLSLGMLDAFEMIFGKEETIKAIPFKKGEGLPQVQEKFQKEVEGLADGDSLLFLVDVFGGTPYNAAAQVAYSLENVDIVTGVNLPMLLEVATAKTNNTLKKLVVELKTSTVSSIRIFSEEMSKASVQNEEDLL